MHPAFCPAPPLILETGSNPVASLIFIHGLGTSGRAFRPLCEQIAVRLARPVRIVLPHAPPRPVSVYDSQVAPAWFDLLDADFLAREDEAGLTTASGYLAELIDGEIARGILPETIMLGGFSQGGALVLLTGLSSRYRLGGIVALSGWLPLADGFIGDRSGGARTTPVFLGHGERDRITPVAMAEAARDRMVAWGHPVELRTYPIGHAINQTEIRDVGDWLATKVGVP